MNEINASTTDPTTVGGVSSKSTTQAQGLINYKVCSTSTLKALTLQVKSFKVKKGGSRMALVLPLTLSIFNSMLFSLPCSL